MSGTVPAPVLCLLGPTAMGKTEIAMRLADHLPVDLISVDSALVYRGMDIGTAKPTPETLARYPHALVDIVDPEYAYSVANFVRDARASVEATLERGRVPLLVGGTMLYFKRLLEGLAPLPEADPAVRAALDEQAARDGWPALHARLVAIDPEAADRIASNDAQRIQRALEVFELTGTPITELQRRAPVPGPPWQVLRVALLSNDRTRLHQRINARFDQMMRDGFVEEVTSILQRPGVHTALPSMRAVGYRQIGAWLQGGGSREQAVADAKTATRRLAKRQHTWLRSMPDLQCFDPLEGDVLAPILKLCEAFVRTAGVPI